MEYDEGKVSRANRIAEANPQTQFILYYREGSEPPAVRHDNVDLKASRSVMDGRFLMHDKVLQLTGGLQWI